MTGIEYIPSEDQEQELVIQWCDRMEQKYPGVSRIFAVPNGGQRNKTTAARMKRTGTRAGVPDLFLPVPRGEYHGLFLEMKRRKGGQVSLAQKEYMAFLLGEGYACTVCKGYDEAVQAITDYYSGYIVSLF